MSFEYKLKKDRSLRKKILDKISIMKISILLPYKENFHQIMQVLSHYLLTI